MSPEEERAELEAQLRALRPKYKAEAEDMWITFQIGMGEWHRLVHEALVLFVCATMLLVPVGALNDKKPGHPVIWIFAGLALLFMIASILRFRLAPVTPETQTMGDSTYDLQTLRMASA